MSGGGLEVHGLRRISDPNWSGLGGVWMKFRLPVDLAFNKFSHGVVCSLAEDPLLALEIVMTAGERHGKELAGFHEFDLPAVHFFTKRVDHWRFCVPRLERRHDLADRLRQVDCYQGAQSIGAFQPNVAMQNPEIGARG